MVRDSETIILGWQKILISLIDSTAEIPPFLGEVTTDDATHNKLVMLVLGRTYAAVRDLQVVEGAG